jgi:hypothetical protein
MMVSLGAWLMTLAGNTVYPCGSIDAYFDPSLFPLDSTFKVIFCHGHQPYAVFFAALYLPHDGGGELSCSISVGDPLYRSP